MAKLSNLKRFFYWSASKKLLVGEIGLIEVILLLNEDHLPTLLGFSNNCLLIVCLEVRLMFD